MWSDDKNCDVSDDLPTPEAPSIATRYCFGGLGARTCFSLSPEALLSPAFSWSLRTAKDPRRLVALEGRLRAKSMQCVYKLKDFTS